MCAINCYCVKFQKLEGSLVSWQRNFGSVGRQSYQVSNLLLSEHTEIADVFPPIYLYDFLPCLIILTD